MDTKDIILELRTKLGLSQEELAEKVFVTRQAVSRWENGETTPNTETLKLLSKVLGVSVIELMNGEHITNKNISANMLRCKFYVCPICGNVIHSFGQIVTSCCGITLPALEAEDADSNHMVTIQNVEDEQFITVHHPMSKGHFVSFLAHVTSDRLQMVKLYPEGNPEARLQLRGRGYLYYYCNRHGLFRKKL